jgi:hypothetical protein
MGDTLLGETFHQQVACDLTAHDGALRDA